MKIALAGPFATEPFAAVLGSAFERAPKGIIQTPLGPLGLELLKRGHEVSVITHDPAVQSAVRINVGNLTLIYLPQRHRARHRILDLYEEEALSIKHELIRIAPDVVHAHWTYEYAEGAIRSKFPHVITMHDIPLQIAWMFKNAYRALRLIMGVRVLTRAKLLSVVSPGMVGWARLHGYRGSLEVIPNGIDDFEPSNDRDVPALLDRPVIVTVGDLSRRKNVPNSIIAFRRIRAMFPNAELHLFGHGLDSQYAQSEQSVFCHGSVPHSELMGFLDRRASILVHTALQETFGVILAEALARKVPVIAGESAGGCAYVMGPDLKQMLVDVKRADAIAARVAEILHDPSLYNRMATLGQRRVQEMFSAREMTSRYCDLYQRAMSEQ